MMFRIIPESLDRAIEEKIKQALQGRPISPGEREYLHQYFIDYFDEHGMIPDFTLEDKPTLLKEGEP